MKKSVLSLLTGAALLGGVGVASAAEPMVLTNAAMDGITAGQFSQSNSATQSIGQTQSSTVTATNSLNSAPSTLTVTTGAQNQTATNSATQSNTVGNITAGTSLTF